MSNVRRDSRHAPPRKRLRGAILAMLLLAFLAGVRAEVVRADEGSTALPDQPAALASASTSATRENCVGCWPRYRK